MGRIIQNGIVYSGSSGGGGGGSGHTILDNEGDALTQRTNLQFLGAYSGDDGTDDATQVNVVRSMTKAEFDTLSDDEKVGFINITDITGGNDDRFQPVIYSDEEREIGVYTDGKPLYEKTIYSATVTDATEVAHNIANIDKVAEVKCNILRYGTWNSGNFIFENNNHFSVVVSKTTYFCACTPATGVYNNLYLTIRYTKTTDTAGSGQWTPQGVPAVHYESTEHIVGTWVDGSTIYEQTVLSTTYIGSSATVIYDTTSIGWDKIIDISAIMDIYIPNETDDIIASLKGPADLYVGLGKHVYAKQALATYMSGRTMETYITLRYTKSSS